MKIQENWKKNALVSPKDYEDLYNLSIKDNEGFWKDQGNRLDWVKKYSKIKERLLKSIPKDAAKISRTPKDSPHHKK